jgi:hypothetical protein
MSPELIADGMSEYAGFSLFVEEQPSEKPVKRQREDCVCKQQFEASVRDFCQQALVNPTHISINQAYLMLFKKFMEFRAAVPKKCRNHVGERGKLCIWHALEQSYLQLRRAELMLAPPLLFLSPPEPPKVADPVPPPPLFSDICIDEPQ